MSSAPVPATAGTTVTALTITVIVLCPSVILWHVIRVVRRVRAYKNGKRDISLHNTADGMGTYVDADTLLGDAGDTRDPVAGAHGDEFDMLLQIPIVGLVLHALCFRMHPRLFSKRYMWFMRVVYVSSFVAMILVMSLGTLFEFRALSAQEILSQASFWLAFITGTSTPITFYIFTTVYCSSRNGLAPITRDFPRWAGRWGRELRRGMRRASLVPVSVAVGYVGLLLATALAVASDSAVVRYEIGDHHEVTGIIMIGGSTLVLGVLMMALGAESFLIMAITIMVRLHIRDFAQEEFESVEDFDRRFWEMDEWVRARSKNLNALWITKTGCSLFYMLAEATHLGFSENEPFAFRFVVFVGLLYSLATVAFEMLHFADITDAYDEALDIPRRFFTSDDVVTVTRAAASSQHIHNHCQRYSFFGVTINRSKVVSLIASTTSIIVVALQLGTRTS